jgi:hypothetical protein
MEKVKLLLNDSHLAPQDESRNVIMGMIAWRSRNTAPGETPSPPSWRAKCRSSFMTLSPVLLQEQPTVVLLLERALVSWSLAMDERSGHQDLCGSGHQSVTPYAHGIMGLYCSSLALPV